MNELTTLQECLKAAQIKRHQFEELSESIIFRIEPTLKKRAQLICDKHHINLSEYLRKCCEGLIADYMPEKLSQE